MPQKLENRVAVITGAASGMGRATALLFAQEGASVVVADADAAGAQDTVENIRAAGGKAVVSCTDVTKAPQVEAMINLALQTYGRIDILHNNAGVIIVKFLEDTSEEEWDWVLGVNVKSIFLAVKYAIPCMKRQGGGCIINTASTGSFMGQYMTPAYIASKGAVLLLTKTLSLDYAKFNVRVNCICPGAVDTPMLRRHFNKSPDPDLAARREQDLMPIGRFLEPEEIAEGALYLASDAARGVTGTSLVIDGGSLAGPYAG
jgi:NAD(P)-dependent dehydrogenase (short-subunit alcohol dehydrogenase family)